MRQQFLQSVSRSIWTILTLLIIYGLPVLVRADDVPLRLSDEFLSVNPWPYTQYAFPENDWHPTQLLSHADKFSPVTTPSGVLGAKSKSAWLRIPLYIDTHGTAQWLMNIHYSSLNFAEIYLFDQHQLIARHKVGSAVENRYKSWDLRGNIIPINVPKTGDYSLYIHAYSDTGIIIPILFQRQINYLEGEIFGNFCQGLSIGLGLCLLFYSMSQWYALREPLFGYYALTSASILLLSSALSDLGNEYLWAYLPWMQTHAVTLLLMITLSVSFKFLRFALDLNKNHQILNGLLKYGNYILLLLIIGYIPGLISERFATYSAYTLAFLPTFIVLSHSFPRVISGDIKAFFILLAGISYTTGLVTMVLLLAGKIAATSLTLNAFQTGLCIESALWILILSLRHYEINKNSMAVQSERDSIHKLATTDPLTNLVNRRGLQESLNRGLSEYNNTENNFGLLYLFDLDGFKEINDNHGHDIGDLVLRKISERLENTINVQTDTLCRLGGDEFVLLTFRNLSTIEARNLGKKIISDINFKIKTKNGHVRVSATVGYTKINKNQPIHLGQLLKRADRAMYKGKNKGKGISISNEELTENEKQLFKIAN